MANRLWTVPLGGETYAVAITHGYFSGKRRITVNDQVVVDIKSNLVDFGSEHPIQLGSQEAIVIIRPGLTFKFDLFIDGKSVDTGKPYQPLRAARVFSKDGTGQTGLRFSKWTIAGMVVGNIFIGIGANAVGFDRVLLFTLGGAIMGGSFGAVGFETVRRSKKGTSSKDTPVGPIPEGWLMEVHTEYPANDVITGWAAKHRYEEVRLPDRPSSRFFRKGGTLLQRQVVQTEIEGGKVRINAWIYMSGGTSVPLERDNDFSIPARKCRSELNDLLVSLGQA